MHLYAFITDLVCTLKCSNFASRPNFGLFATAFHSYVMGATYQLSKRQSVWPNQCNTKNL